MKIREESILPPPSKERLESFELQGEKTVNKLTKMDLIKRWQTYEGKKKRKQILESLIHNRSIEKLPFIEKVNGYYDLRGLLFDSKTRLEKVHIKGIDFSYCNFNYLLLNECTIDDVVFEMCDCTEMLQYRSMFKNSKFTKSKFLNAGFGIHGGSYTNILFVESNFKGAAFFSPDFNECTFTNCILEGVDFKASHFKDVKFIGKLDDVWFRGELPDGSQNEEEKVRGLNPMIVDFSDAYLWFVTYSDNCNLSNVKIPKDGQHSLIYNFHKVIECLENEIIKISDMKEQKFIKEFIEMYKYHVVKQDMVILNKEEVISSAQYYLGKEAKNYCENFVETIIKISNSSLRCD